MDGTTYQSQRKGIRLPVRLTCSLVADTGSKEFRIPAESINLSKCGMRLRTETQLSSGQTVEVILLVETLYHIMARVVWVDKTTSSNQFELGLEYITPSQQPV